MLNECKEIYFFKNKELFRENSLKTIIPYPKYRQIKKYKYKP